VTPEIIRASAREAEALGYRSFWVNHPGPVDGLGSLAHAAAETRRVDLGVGVVPLHTRDPRYGFDRHKGYATRDHLDAVARHGYSAAHRRSFRPPTLFDRMD
jgi:hypothetical protein